ncbi:expressed unknown protein [Seminavis robusta]|uniref:Uncharacterized protein n=1 Tax=Seminavis robusta TaxID=568900 RepID=A0A9N8D829_9STRA|nr:expressed unknown protein [Seminavis robusta]|eukprot:Sro35_g022350.1 n/a (99) ;mRNA; r:76644-76940
MNGSSQATPPMTLVELHKKACIERKNTAGRRAFPPPSFRSRVGQAVSKFQATVPYTEETALPPARNGLVALIDDALAASSLQDTPTNRTSTGNFPWQL